MSICLPVCVSVRLSGNVAPSEKLVHFSPNFNTMNGPRCVSVQIVPSVAIDLKELGGSDFEMF